MEKIYKPCAELKVTLEAKSGDEKYTPRKKRESALNANSPKEGRKYKVNMLRKAGLEPLLMLVISIS